MTGSVPADGSVRGGHERGAGFSQGSPVGNRGVVGATVFARRFGSGRAHMVS